MVWATWRLQPLPYAYGTAATKQLVNQRDLALAYSPGVAAACEEGLPDQSAFARWLKQAGSPQGLQELISQPEFFGQDSWQVQIQAQVQAHADVFLYSDGLDESQLKTSQLFQCQNPNDTIPELIKQYGPRTCVLPQGPLTILELTGC